MTINKFEGEFDFLSNFSLHAVEYDGTVWPTAEHAFQAAKTNNEEQKVAIWNALTPGHAKKMGKKVTLRHDWEEKKIDVMLQIVRSKFTNEELKQKLLATGDTKLVEGNYWNDRFWGVCQGEGQNHLGRILMQVREEIRNERKAEESTSNA